MFTILTALVFAFSPASATPSAHYGFIMDAGSSGTRIHIYQWGQRYSLTTDPVITEYIPSNSTDANALQNNLPLSGYAGQAQNVGNTILPLIQQAQRWVPMVNASQYPIILRATAGMRLLATSDQDAVITAVRTLLSDKTQNPFWFQNAWATIAAGEEEASWSWIMANYVEGLLVPTTAPTSYVGTMEIGGASAQIDFIPTDELLSNKFTFYVFGKPISVYAHSFLYFGKDQFNLRARILAVQKQSPNTTLEMPCFYTGYNETFLYNNVNYTIIGTSDYDDCYNNYSQALFAQDSAPCLQAPCSFAGVYHPALPSTLKMWGISDYFYTLNGINPTVIGWNSVWTGTATQIEPMGRAQCAKNWTKAQIDDAGTELDFIATYCLDACHMLSDLRAHSAGNFNITYARKFKGQTVGWPLGALIDAFNFLPLDPMPANNSCFSSATPTQSPTLVTAFLMMLLGFFGLI